ncbi:signal transduction protein [Bacterioplanes sanyensis]|uniref:Signal transduction protein n=1 Tax=Bacterioplanes sanyensis TaxID=1249553 RepID=A0A222FPN1_9GAMM|nr:signal transduction protein [Bacterioplanes sanyensis]
MVAYELLYRPLPPLDQQAQVLSGDQATRDVMVSAFHDLGIQQVTGGLPAYINFTEHWLQNPPLLPPDALVAEVIEYTEATAPNIEALQRLRHYGYRVALDDFSATEAQTLMLPLADIVKVDLRLIDDLQQVEILFKRHFDERQIWLAEKVENHEEFEFCRELGFSLFQGYFFDRPKPLFGKRLADNKVAVLQLLQVLNQPDVNIDSVVTLLHSEPQLSFKLLQLVNSAAVGCVTTISSIRHALVLVGLDRIRSWTNILALGRLDDKPMALREQALVRAHCCQLLAERAGLEADAAFTLGLFSLLDAFTDLPMSDICQRLRFSHELSQALLQQQGHYGWLLRTLHCIERGAWDQLEWPLLQGHTIDRAVLHHSYRQAIDDTRALLLQLGDINPDNQ